MQHNRYCFSFCKSFCLVLLIFSSAILRSATINIPADKPTIQAGIDAASNGDTVLVAPGTYYENIDFKGKAITVTSSDGPAKTIIDGGAKTATVSFRSAELRSSVLSNFTIQNGGPNTNAGNIGGGIYIVESAPTIAGNIITNNACHAVQVSSGSPLLQSNTMSRTSALPGYCDFNGSGILLIGNTNSGLHTTIINNIIEQNLRATAYTGGGIFIWAHEGAVIQGNVIRNNSATNEGGAVVSFNTLSLTIVQNLIVGNSASNGGAAISLHPPDTTIGQFIGIIAGNTISNSSFSSTNPSTTVPAGQVYLEGNLAQYALINNIISWQNALPSVVCGTTYNYLSLTPLVFDHNDIYNSQGPAYGGACPDQTGTYGNISAPPLFKDVASSDYHLIQGSPAIDAGNDSAPLFPTTDLDGSPRLRDSTGKGYPIVDMGAYEFGGLQNANPTILTLTPSTYRTYGSGNLTLTAKLTSANGTPTGSLTFYADGNQIGVNTIDGNGLSTLPVKGLVPGVHAFIATYIGEGAFTAAVSVKFYVLVDKYNPTFTITSSLNPSLLNQPVTFTITNTTGDGSTLSPLELVDGPTSLASLTPDSNGVAVFTTSSLALGQHTIQVRFAGDATHAAANSSLVQTVLSGYPTPSSLTSSLNPSTIGQSVTFTDTITFNGSATATGSGTVTFYDSNSSSPLGSQAITAQPNSTVTASFTTSALSIGTHSISAVLSTTNSYVSTATLNQTVFGIPTTTAIAVTPSDTDALQPVTLTATVSSGVTAPAISGFVTFYDGSTSIGTSRLDATGHASFVTTSLAGGTRSLHAVYSGDNNFASSTSFNIPAIIRFLASTTALSLAPLPAVAGQPITATVTVAPIAAQYPLQLCLCTVTVSITGLPPNTAPTYTLPLHNGVATFNFGLGFPAGSYTFTASFSGSSAFSASKSVTVPVTIAPAPTTITLAGTPNPAVQGQNVSLTATVTAPLSAAMPPGTITFYDGPTAIGSASFGTTGPAPVSSISNSATVTINTSSLSAGTHTITASYPGIVGYLPSASAPLTLVVKPQDFAIAVSDPTISIRTEYHFTTQVTLTSIGAFADNVSLSCTDLPAHASCTFDKATLQMLPNGNATVKLIVDTDDVLRFRSDLVLPTTHRSPLSSLAIIFPAGILAFTLNRKCRSLPRLLLYVVAALTLLAPLSGCDGLYPKSTAPGTYSIKVTGVGATTKLTHSALVSLSVTP